MRPDLERYDRFGWDYELHNPLSEKAVSWYAKFASDTGGPVLELACGTGRLLAALAEEGFDVAGIDLSETMLELARQRLAQCNREVQQRVRLYRMDMAHFQLDRQFGLIYIADNSFRELKTRPQHQSCLKCIRRRLRPEGKLLITERRFNPSLFANGRRGLSWSEPLCDPRTGDLVQRKAELQLSQDGKWIHGRFLYRTIHPNGTETMDECPIDAPVFQKEDYLALFSEAGFATDVFVDYELREDDGKNPILCFVCAVTG